MLRYTQVSTENHIHVWCIHSCLTGYFMGSLIPLSLSSTYPPGFKQGNVISVFKYWWLWAQSTVFRLPHPHPFHPNILLPPAAVCSLLVVTNKPWVFCQLSCLEPHFMVAEAALPELWILHPRKFHPNFLLPPAALCSLLVVTNKPWVFCQLSCLEPCSILVGASAMPYNALA